MAAVPTPQVMIEFLKHHFGNFKDVVFAQRSSPNWPALLGGIVFLLVLDQVLYVYKKLRYGYAGPLFTVPFLGGIAQMSE